MMIKKILLALLTALLILTGCDLLQDSEETTGSLSLTLPGEARLVTQSDITDYAVTLTCEALEYSYETTALPGATIEVESLNPGSYIVNLEAFNSTDICIYVGNAVAVISAGEQTDTTVDMTINVGDISVDVTLPDDPVNPEGWYWSGFVSSGSSKETFINDDGIIFKVISTETRYGGTSSSVITYTEEWTIDNGVRTGSVLKNEDDDILQTSVITVDSNGLETRIDYYDGTDTSDPSLITYYYIIEYNTEKTA